MSQEIDRAYLNIILHSLRTKLAIDSVERKVVDTIIFHPRSVLLFNSIVLFQTNREVQTFEFTWDFLGKEYKTVIPPRVKKIKKQLGFITYLEEYIDYQSMLYSLINQVKTKKVEILNDHNKISSGDSL